MIKELEQSTGSLFFWGCYLYELGLSQKERDRLGLPPLTDAEKEFVANARKRMEYQKTAKEESKENPEPVYNDNDKFITLRVPLKDAAPGWGLKLQKPVFPRVEIPKSEGVDRDEARWHILQVRGRNDGFRERARVPRFIRVLQLPEQTEGRCF